MRDIRRATNGTLLSKDKTVKCIAQSLNSRHCRFPLFVSKKKYFVQSVRVTLAGGLGRVRLAKRIY